MDKAIRIYRDSVLVKQEEMLRKLDMEYDGYIKEIRLKQDEIKRKIKLLFYKEINYIDHISKYRNGDNQNIIEYMIDKNNNNDMIEIQSLKTHQKQHKNNNNLKNNFNENGNNQKSICMNIYSLSDNHSNDSSDIPILDENINNECNKICNNNGINQILPSLSSLPPLPPQLQLTNIINNNNNAQTQNLDTNITLDPQQTLQYLQANNPQIFNNIKSILTVINNNTINNNQQQQKVLPSMIIPPLVQSPAPSQTSNNSNIKNNKSATPNLPDLIKYLNATDTNNNNYNYNDIKTKKEEETFEIPELVEIPNNIIPSAIMSNNNNKENIGNISNGHKNPRKRKRCSVLGDITNSNNVHKKARLRILNESESNSSSELLINDENDENYNLNLNLEDIPLIDRAGIMINDDIDSICKTSNGDKWKCKYCRKWIIYSNDDNIIKHLSAHKLERKFKCKYCDKIFKRHADVIRHSRTHTGEKPHKCTICGKGFGTKYCLKTHLRIHTGELPYKCSFCGKQFRQNSHLTVHWRVHTGDKPYECKICNKRFGQHSTLQVHQRIHQNGKPFICPCCPNKRDFTQRHSLQRHIKTVHKEYYNKYGCDQIQNLEKINKLKKKAKINEKAKKEILGK